MKKIFALALAAVMTAGMTTVAFAADKDVEGVGFSGYVFADLDGDGTIDDTFQINRGDTTVDQDTLGDTIIAGGTTLYFGVQAKYEGDAGFGKVNKLSDVERWKIDADWSVGEAEKPYFDQAKVNGSYGVYMIVELPENDTTKNEDLIGTIGIGKTTTDAKNASANDLAEISVTYGRDKTNVAGNVDIKEFDGDFPAPFDTKGAVVDFDNVQDEIDIDFNDLALFTVDVTSQGKLDLRFKTDFLSDFAEKYDYANIDFLTFPGEPTFNKNGDFYIYADEDAFVYEVTADGAKEINGLEWSDEYDAWHFKTRKLTSYAISDVELDEKTVTEDKDDTTTDGGKENPDTGR